MRGDAIIQDSTAIVLGWHWLPANRKLRFAPFTVVEAGVTLEAVGPLQPCRNGLHACRRAVDALQYVHGPALSRVALSGQIIEDGDQLVARRRAHLWIAEPERVHRALDEWFYWLTEQVLRVCQDAGQEVADEEWTALKVAAAWLDGTTGSEALLAAAWLAAGAARSPWQAWAARAAWAAREARPVGAWEARAAWEAWEARAPWEARAVWSAWLVGAVWAAGSTWDAWSARAARAAWDPEFNERANRELEARFLRLAPSDGPSAAEPTGPQTAR